MSIDLEKMEPPDVSAETRSDRSGDTRPPTNRIDHLAVKRYGPEHSALPLRFNATLDVMLGHRSVRAYRPEPLPDGTLETIVAAAQSAPSSSNLQVWSVVAVEDAKRKRRLAGLAGPNPQIEAAPLLLVFVADLARARAIAISKGVAGEGLDYFESFLLATIDAALAAQNAVTALESLGLGSCYIGAMRNRPVEVAAELRLPPAAMAVFGLTVGVPDQSVGEDVEPRLAQSAVLHRETYRGTPPEAELDAYDRALAAFQRSQRIAERGLTDVVSQRIGTVEALRGRDKLFGIARSLGFGLR